MSWFPQSQDHLPLTWWNRVPIYLAAILALVGLVSMVVTAILMSIDAGWYTRLIFTYEGLITRYQVWTIVSYVFYNPPSIWLVIGLFLLWRFGEEVERHLGRRAFVMLICLLVLLPPVLVVLVALMGLHWGAAGISDLGLGVFLAFVALYPRAQLSVIIATIPAWVMGAVIVGIRVLELLAHRLWGGLIVLAGIVLITWAYVSYHQGRWNLRTVKARLRRPAEPRLSSPRPRPSPRDTDVTVLPPYREGREENDRKSTRSDAAKVDAILEKISTQGLQSLTPEERKILEQAREQLKRKG